MVVCNSSSSCCGERRGIGVLTGSGWHARSRPDLATIVIDASALVEVLLRTPRAAAILDLIGEAEMVAPDLISVEVLSTLRRLVQRSDLSAARADGAVGDLLSAPVRRLPTLPLVDAAWGLRPNLSAHDACYVALAEVLGSTLISGDGRLARAPRLPVPVVVP